MDESLKLPLAVFNLTVVVYVLAIWVTSDPMYFGSFAMQAAIGAVIGLVTGGITWFVTKPK